MRYTQGYLFILFLLLSAAVFPAPYPFNFYFDQPDSLRDKGVSLADSAGADSSEEMIRIGRIASELAVDLADRLRLTDQISHEISGILKDYQLRVLEEKSDSFDTGKERLENPDEVTGSSIEVLEKFKELDESTSHRISSLLNSRERDEYSSIKDEWWTKVRDRVYENEGARKNNNTINDDLNRDELDSLPPPPPSGTGKDSLNIN